MDTFILNSEDYTVFLLPENISVDFAFPVRHRLPMFVSGKVPSIQTSTAVTFSLYFVSVTWSMPRVILQPALLACLQEVQSVGTMRLSLLTPGLSFLFALYRSKPPLSKPITESHSGETLLIGESLFQPGSFSRLLSPSPVG